MSKRKYNDIDGNETNDLKELNVRLKQEGNPCPFAVDGEAYELPSIITIDVEDFGELDLPLKDPQASELIKRCQQSQFGKNTETKLDINVRDSYQLEPWQFSIIHPDWDKQLKKLVSRVALELGCDAELKAKIYKLLVYKEGGHFSKHKDSQKEDHMFATLIIQPPSIHEGGHLVVYKTDTDKKEIDFGQMTHKSRYSMHFAAHYADLDHELLKIKSGYRLALVYSLCWASVQGNLFNKKSITNANSTELSVVLKNLSQLFDEKCILGILLDHLYTPQTLREMGIEALKGVDKARYNLLAQANSLLSDERKLAFYICEASLNRHWFEKGYDSESLEYYTSSSTNEDDDDSWWGEEEKKYEFKEWYDVDGNKAACDTDDIDVDFFTHVLNPTRQIIGLKDKYTWGSIARIRCAQYANDPAAKEYQYEKCMLVLCPRNQFPTMNVIDISASIDFIYHMLIEENHAADPASKFEFVKICSRLCSNKSQAELLKAKSFAQIFHLITLFNMEDEFKKLLSNCKIKLNANCAKNLALAISKFGFKTLEKTLQEFLKPSIDNFINIFALVQMMNDENQTDVALKIFVNLLLPLLTNAKNCEAITKTAFGYIYPAPNKKYEFEESSSKSNHLLNFVKFFEFYSQQTSVMLQVLKNSMLKLLDEKCEWSNLISLFAKESQLTIQNSQSLLAILEQQKQRLEKKAAEEQSSSDDLDKLKLFFSR